MNLNKNENAAGRNLKINEKYLSTAKTFVKI